MSKKVLIRKQAGGGGIMYTREVGGRGQGGFMQDLAAVRGGAMGLNAQGGQSFIPGAQLGDAKPTGMQRLAAGANLAGRGLAAALTGLQTAYGLQGGNVGALGSVGDTYAQNVQGLTANRPTEAQQAQNMATEAFNTQQQQMANDAMQQSAQQTMNQPVNVGSSSPRGPAPAGLPAPPVPAPTTPAPAAPAQAAPAQAAPAQAPATPATSNPINPQTAAQLLPPLPTGQAAPAESNPINPQAAAEMLPNVSQPTTTPTEPPANPAMAMFREVQNQKAMREGRETPFANQEFDPNTREGQAMAMFREVQAAKRARMQAGEQPTTEIPQNTPSGNNLSVIGGKVMYNGQEMEPDAQGNYIAPGIKITGGITGMPTSKAPVAVSQPVNQGGPAPYEQTLPVMMPQRTHEQQRVAVKPPVTTPYTPQSTVNPFANPTGQKPGHAYNTGQYAPTQQQYGLSSNVDYRNRAMPANFGGISWDSAVPTLGDDPNINWTEELSKAFAKFVLNDFGDMLHKADPHVAGALAMRVFLEKMLRK